MATVLDYVDSLVEELKKLLPMSPEDRQRLDKKFRLEFNYNSNHMEGNTLTYGETELLLIFDDTKGNHTMREYEEMKAHDAAYHLVDEWAKDKERPLTEQNIKNLNEVILVRPFWKDAITQEGQPTRRLIEVGNYKTHPNSVRLQNGEIFHYAKPSETPILMQELIDWYREEENNLHPVTLAAMLHYKFVTIHPFDDGNGRVSRLLMNYVLLKNDLPPVIIKSDDKAGYLRALNRADIGDYEPFINYIAEQVAWSLDLTVKAAKGESIEETGDFQKEIKLLKQKASGLDPTKSPKLVYSIFEQVATSTWKKITETLSHFDGLFTDSKATRHLNMMGEHYPKNRMIDLVNGPLVSSAPSTLKIFGHNIYETDVRFVDWRITQYGLIGSTGASQFETHLRLSFEQKYYKIELKTNGTILYDVEKKYNDVLLTDGNDSMIKSLQQYMLAGVKKNIGGSND